MLLSVNRNSSTAMYPRAAVAATVQLTWLPNKGQVGWNKYLLVQRANQPDQGLWSIPGGKIELGETTLQAAQREIYEETQLATTTNSFSLHWHSDPFMTTDAIFKKDDDGGDEYTFHYVIAHCFASFIVQGNPSDIIPRLRPSDDALDAKWWTMEEIEDLKASKKLSDGVTTVLKRAEYLSQLGALQTS
jgi:8-oxo-dGTP diphosphatase